MTEEMPLHLEVGARIDLFQCLLDTVLPEITLPGSVRLADQVDGECLGNGDEADGRGVAAG